MVLDFAPDLVSVCSLCVKFFQNPFCSERVTKDLSSQSNVEDVYNISGISGCLLYEFYKTSIDTK